MAGYRGYYVPESVAYHQGFGTFEPQLGKGRCDQLASRNTLIFMWKNTSGARLLAHFLWLPVRLASCAGARTVQLCLGPRSRPSAVADRVLAAGARWPWGRGAGSRGKRRSFGGFSGRDVATSAVDGAGEADSQHSDHWLLTAGNRIRNTQGGV